METAAMTTTGIDAIGMLQVAVALLALTALGGVVMAGIRLARKHNPPAWFSMGHGLLAAAGVTLLAYAYVATDAPSPAGWALLLFLVAATGGAAMNLGWQWKHRPLPLSLMFAHAAIAVVAFGCLLVAAF